MADDPEPDLNPGCARHEASAHDSDEASCRRPSAGRIGLSAAIHRALSSSRHARSVNAARATVASILAIVVLVDGCSAPISDAASSASDPARLPTRVTQTSDGGQVTAVVEWASPAADLVFHVTLDTHSVDLDPLDLADAFLRNDRGEMLAARPWAAPKGGHHRAGALAFEGDAARFLADAAWIELVLKGVGDLAERTLRWELGS